MEEIKQLSVDVIERIKDLTIRIIKEQESLINKLISDEELKQRYKKKGLCKECKQPNIGFEYVTFNGISKFGLAEIMMMISLFRKRN